MGNGNITNNIQNNLENQEIIENDSYEYLDIARIQKVREEEKKWNRNSIIYNNKMSQINEDESNILSKEKNSENNQEKEKKENEEKIENNDMIVSVNVNIIDDNKNGNDCKNNGVNGDNDNINNINTNTPNNNIVVNNINEPSCDKEKSQKITNQLNSNNSNNILKNNNNNNNTSKPKSPISKPKEKLKANGNTNKTKKQTTENGKPSSENLQQVQPQPTPQIAKSREQEEKEEMDRISKILPFSKLLRLKQEDIIHSGFLEKLVQTPYCKTSCVCSERFCTLTKNYFSYFKSKESYIIQNRPMLKLNLKYIKKLEKGLVGDGKNSYLEIFCEVNEETKMFEIKNNSLINSYNNNEGGEEGKEKNDELMLIFVSKNYVDIASWYISLKYLTTFNKN